MKRIFYIAVILSQAFIATSYSGPMESHTNYNVILVHGAGGEMYGIDCDGSKNEKEANGYERKDGYLTLTGGYGRRFGDVTLNEVEFNLDSNMFGFGADISYMKNRESSAEDMDLVDNDKKGDEKYIGLRHWLADSLFEGDRSLAYLQRPFTNPANSPVNNARELGDPKWKGDKKCDVRRSLIEEAQEVRANGRDKLINLRKNVENRNKLPPSRNILIAHSMGGVTSREYVQGNGYNNDVDKVITLDSPHEGTGSLEMLLEMSDIQSRAVQVGTNTLTTIAATSAILAAASKDVPTATVALYSFLPVLGLNATTYGLGYALIKGLDKHYKKSDPLVPYIDPNYSRSGGINNLKNRPYTDSLPMMRLLYGTNSMTFSDPKDEIVNDINAFIPKSLASYFYNLYSQFSGSGSTTTNFINSLTAGTAGLLFGVTIGEHGTTLIPQKSGKAENTKSFDNPRADVMKRSFDGHITKDTDKTLEYISIEIAVLATSIVAVDYMPFFPPPVAASIKSGLALGIGLALVADAAVAIRAGIKDLIGSHEAPLKSEFQSKWKAAPNTYSKLLGGQISYEPYRMEEFLYEKPFANIQVISTYSKDWEDGKEDFLGLYVGDSLKPVYTDKLSNPLTFKSPSDWETFGAKKVRWDNSVQGVGGNKVPIRHVDRYPMPSFMVTDFIYEYKFEIDDLMPHRLRQIRLNFNFNEEIAWECDISKADTSTTACVVYQRTPSSNGWKAVDTTAHPVKKDGLDSPYEGIGHLC